MTIVLRAPGVPYLDTYNVLDLDVLEGRDLETSVQLENAPLGQFLHPRWLGTAPDGSAVDITGPSVQIIDPNATLQVLITYQDLQTIDQGHALYSYTIQPTQDYQHDFPESLRVAIWVGSRHFPGAGLSVAVVKQAHRLQFNRSDLPSSGATVAVAPWQTMRAGDVLTLEWRGYRSNGSATPVYNQVREIAEDEIGLPVPMTIALQQFILISDGYGLLNYWIEYAGGNARSVAPSQRFEIIPAATDRLPALTILEHSGSALDPDVLAAQITFSTGRYPELSEGDTLVVYAEDPATQVAEAIACVRLDRSSVDSGLLQCKVSGEWLWEYLDGEISLSYHVTRPAMALRSEPLRLAVRQAMKLPMPVVEGASGAGEAQGEFKATATGEGVKVWVPSSAVYPATAGLEMHWQGFAGTGSHIARVPTNDTPPAFIIPAGVVAPNMGKEVRIFYRVVVASEPPRDSAVFTLKVLPIPEYFYPTLNCVQASNGVLRRTPLTAAGSNQTIAPWPLAAVGQHMDVIATGTLNGGPTTTRYLLQDMPVSNTHVTAGVTVALAKSWLDTLQLNKEITFTVRLTADEGLSYITFPRVYIMLVA